MEKRFFKVQSKYCVTYLSMLIKTICTNFDNMTKQKLTYSLDIIHFTCFNTYI